MMSESAFERLANAGGYGIPNEPQAFVDVYRALRAELEHDDLAFVKTPQLDLEMSNDTIGRLVHEFKDWPDCPISIEVWAGQSSPPRTYRLTWADGGDSDE